MEITTQPSLILQGVDILHVNLNVINKYDHKTPIDLKVDPKVFYPKEQPSHFKIIMDVILQCENYFDLSIVAIGNFGFGNEEELPDNVKKTFVNTNAPAIMFPYVRAFISTLSSNIGNSTGTIVIPSQFFKGELEELPSEADKNN